MYFLLSVFFFFLFSFFGCSLQKDFCDGFYFWCIYVVLLVLGWVCFLFGFERFYGFLAGFSFLYFLFKRDYTVSWLGFLFDGFYGFLAGYFFVFLGFRNGNEGKE